MDDLERVLWVMERYSDLSKEDREGVMHYMGTYVQNVRPSIAEMIKEAETVMRGILALRKWTRKEK